MARPETLVPGNCYFSVSFYDSDLVLPMIETLVYVGQERGDDGKRLWVFEEPNTASDADMVEKPAEPPELTAFSDQELYRVLDFDGVVRKLREVASNHPLTRSTEMALEAAESEDLASVAAEVTRFMNDPEYVSLTMTIQFTDDGVSIARRDGRYEMHFFTHPRRDPEGDSTILSLFAGIGVHPVVDYVCDRGRTRVLQFSIPGEVDSIVDLCRRVLREVYSMRRGDVLDFHPLRSADVRTGRQGS